MRSHIFTERDREKLLSWLRDGKEDVATRMLFVNVRRNYLRIASDVELLVLISRKLRRDGRFHGRASLPRDITRELKRRGFQG